MKNFCPKVSKLGNLAIMKFLDNSRLVYIFRINGHDAVYFFL